MTPVHFTGNFTQQEAIPDAGIAAANAVLRTGRLHRYNVAAGEESLAAQLERVYADYQGARFCLACASGGYAMGIAMRAAGVAPGDAVLTNGFTLAPVPGAIASVGGRPILVDITDDLVIDLDDLAAKIDSTKAKWLLLSNMRGHLVGMDQLVDLLASKDVTLIEDCAHTMGASWNGTKSGNFGLAGCFSTQTYKHINSGEGGLLTSDDPEFMARAIMLSGSYMLYDRHGAAPDPEVFKTIRLETPNMSGRMDHLRAAILLPQLEALDDSIDRWNARHDLIADRLRHVPALHIAHRPTKERYVGSSIQFCVPGISVEGAHALVHANKQMGVELKWFGADEPVAFTSNHHSWRYVQAQSLPQTDRILSTLFDMRIPLTFSLEDCAQIAEIIAYNTADLGLQDAAE
jgi:dTDP-4-amino-4,6-dideoxygalactose transaminase